MGSGDAWWSGVRVGALGQDVRRSILLRVKGKLGFARACEALGIAKSSMHRYLKGERSIPDDVVVRALKYLDRGEFEEIVRGAERLRALGVIGEDGSVDYGLALEIIALASRDEYLKNALLRFVVREFRDDLRRMLGISFAGTILRWDEGFEHFLRERKKRRKVRNPETLKYYRNLFKKYLEGRELSEKLIDQVINHPNKWVRNVFRHYIQYLYIRRKISPETFGWIMEVVPSRSYKLDIRPYPIKLEDIQRTMDFLRRNHTTYYTIYRLMLESGARYTHVLRMIEEWNPDEIIEIPKAGLITKRLVCFMDRDFCRYYMGLRDTTKQCEWIYFSHKTLELLKQIAPRKISRHLPRRYAEKHKLVLPKYMRKTAWRLMIKAMSREVARFIQSRFGELKISEARYENLLEEADQSYPDYIKYLSEVGLTRY